MRRTLVASALLLGMQCQASASTPSSFVHLFEWSWGDIAQECEQFLGPKGFSAVQVSPPNEHIVRGEWWARYQPVSYQINSRSGDRQAFADMVSRCKSAGVDIYVDAVINHMAHGSGTGWAGTPYGNYQYSVYSRPDFHSGCQVQDYQNRDQVQYCELLGLPDLKTSNNYVQNTLANYLNDLTSLGVAGFRIDAAKHMPASDLRQIINKLNASPLIFQEVINASGEPIQAQEYTGNGMVTEFQYSNKLAETFRTGKLAWLSTFGEAWGMLPSEQAVVFVDNHDNQRGHGGSGAITYKEGRLYDLANVFMLAYPYGYPKVMSSYAFSDSDQGPPNSPVHQSNRLECFDNAWKCEHRWSYIAGAATFRHYAGQHSLSHWWDNGNNQIAFARGNTGFVAINKEDSQLNVSLPSALPTGHYCDLLSGSLNADKSECSGKVIEITDGGNVEVQLAPWSAFAIHTNAKLDAAPSPSDWKRTVIFVEAQTLPGQDMFIRGGLDHQQAAQQLGLNCNESNYLCAVPMRHNNLLNPTTAVWKSQDTYLDWYGVQAGQNPQASGSPLDWTTNQWPGDWGEVRTVDTHGFGVTPLNLWGPHYWMLDVDMDCSKTFGGWFELKAYVKGGQGWESDIQQANTPYPSHNHFAQCGKINVFAFNEHSALIRDF